MSIVRIALANLRRADSPEASITQAQAAIGYRWPGRFVPPPDAAFLERAWSAISETAARAKIGVVLGTERIVDGAPRITALVINPDGSRAGFQDKVQLDPTEGEFYTPGDGRHVYQVGDLKFGVVICHEGWRYPETVRSAARNGAQVVFHPHYGESEPGSFEPTSFADPRNTFHEAAMLCRAAENTVYFASVNCASAGSPTTSAVANPDGTLLAWQPYAEDGLLIVDIDTTLATGFLASRCRPA
jgi:predicted amidohydrolase